MATTTIKKETFTSYNKVTQLGLTDGNATVIDAWNAMPLSSILITPASAFESNAVPNKFGTVEIVKTNEAGRSYIHFYGKQANNGDYRMYCASNNPPDGKWVTPGQQELIASGKVVNEQVTFDINRYQTIMFHIITSADPMYAFLPAKITADAYWIREGYSGSGFKIGVSNGSANVHQTDMKNGVTFTSYSIYGIV